VFTCSLHDDRDPKLIFRFLLPSNNSNEPFSMTVLLNHSVESMLC
jgi:hypothetical protein